MHTLRPQEEPEALLERMQSQGWRGRIHSAASLSLKYGVAPYHQALIVAQKQEGPAGPWENRQG